jgi:hypothetical protein
MKIPSEFKFVLASGAFGGLVSWAYSAMAGTTFGLTKALALPCCLILGAFAALIAVYQITPTDVTQVGKLITYAALCGFMWKPVIDGGKLAITERIEVATGKRGTERALDNLSSAAPAAAPSQIVAAKDSVTDLLESSNNLGSPELQQQATEQATDAVHQIADSAEKSPQVAAEAIQDIQTKANETNNPQLAAVAGAKLRQISRDFGITVNLGGVSVDATATAAPPTETATTTTQ